MICGESGGVEKMWWGMDEIRMVRLKGGLNTNALGGRQLLHKSNRPHEQRATRRL